MSASGPKPDLRQTAHHVADRAKVSAGWKAIMALSAAMGGILFHPPPVLLIGEEGRRMRGSLGEKIGEGVSADIHAWASGQVVKLFKAGVPQRIGRWEARMTRAVFAAGGPAPEVLDVVTVEGRFGIVLDRLDGPFEQAGAILASLCLSVHKTPPPPDVALLRD